MLKKILLLFIGILIFPFIFDIAYGEEGSIRFELTYPNGDRMSIGNTKLVVSSEDKEIEFERVGQHSEHYFKLELPLQKKYEILVFDNDMLIGTKYLKIEKNNLDVIKIPVNHSIGIKFFVYYNDGLTPIENAILNIYSHEENIVRTTTTDAEGKTQRFWLASTINDGDFYKVEVLIDDLVYQYPPIKRSSGSHDFKIITEWPSKIDSITIQTFSNNFPNYTWGKNFLVEIYDDTKLEKSAKFIRGKAYFSHLNLGEYRVVIFNENNPEKILADTKISVTDNAAEYDISIEKVPVLENSLVKFPKLTQNQPFKTKFENITDFSNLKWTKQSKFGILENNADSEYFLSIISEGEGNPVFTRSKSFTPMDLSDKNFQISYKLDKPLSVKEFWIYFSNDNFESSWYTIKIPISKYFSNEIISKTFDLSNAITIGTPDPTKINQMQIRIKDQTDEKIQLQISGFKILNEPNSIPVIGKKLSFITEVDSKSLIVPWWLKYNAKWLEEEKINDLTLVSGIEYLLNEQIIKLEQSKKQEVSSTKILSWIKNGNIRWSEGKMPEMKFVESNDSLNVILFNALTGARIQNPTSNEHKIFQ